MFVNAEEIMQINWIDWMMIGVLWAHRRARRLFDTLDNFRTQICCVACLCEHIYLVNTANICCNMYVCLTFTRKWLFYFGRFFFLVSLQISNHSTNFISSFSTHKNVCVLLLVYCRIGNLIRSVCLSNSSKIKKLSVYKSQKIHERRNTMHQHQFKS